MWPGAEEGYIDAGAALDDLDLPSFEALLGDSLLVEAGLILPQELMLGPGCSAAGQAGSGQEGSNQPGPGLRQSDSDSEGDAHSMLAGGALRLEAQGRTQQAQAQHVPFLSRQPVREQTHSDGSLTGTATPLESSVGQVQSGVLQRRSKELDKHNQLLMGEQARGAYMGKPLGLLTSYELVVRPPFAGIECNSLVWCSGYHVCLTHTCKIAKGLWFDPRH